MPKKIHKNIAALFIVSTLNACAGLPLIGTEEAAEPEKAAATAGAPPYIDYWQTRDPAEYRRSPPVAGTGDRKPIAPSRDVVISKGEAPVKADKKTGARVSLIIPVQPGVAAPGADRRQSQGQGKTGMVAANPNPAAPPKVQRNPAASNQKGKRKPSAVAGKDLWGRVRGRLALTEVAHARIDEQIEYLKRNPGYVSLFAQRSKPFLHYLVEQIDRRGLPMDLALVPMVESAFEPTAVSPKDAAGLWQIIPTTGQEWGLAIAEGYDGRLDIHASTGVALGYLRYLHKLFKGDWLLALAAYNAGPGAVRDAIEANAREEAQAAAAAKKLAASRPLARPALPLAGQPASASPAAPPPLGSGPLAAPAAGATANAAAPLSAAESPALSSAMAPQPLPPEPESVFWRLKLPKETQDYVPRILALSRIVADPKAYGLQLSPIGNQPVLFRVDVTPEHKIPDLLAASGMPADEFFRFNPGFKPGVEPPPRAYNLLLPLEQAQSLATNTPGARVVAANRYTVRKGETLASIAKRHGVPSQALAQWNSLSVDSVLKAGQKLIVYPAS